MTLPTRVTDGLSVTGLACAYGKNVVLRNVSLEVGPGEIIGLIGRNGAGKTTTLRAISGVVRRRAGTISFRGSPLPASPNRVARQGIVHVPEGRGLIGSLTALENLKVAAYGAGRTLDDDSLALAITIFPRIEGILDRRANVLSGGEQQMVALARALVAKPTVILVDELSLGLAPVVVHEAWRALLRLRSETGLSLLIVDQNIELIQQHCDRVYLLRDGSTRLWDGVGSVF